MIHIIQLIEYRKEKMEHQLEKKCLSLCDYDTCIMLFCKRMNQYKSEREEYNKGRNTGRDAAGEYDRGTDGTGFGRFIFLFK